MLGGCVLQRARSPRPSAKARTLLLISLGYAKTPARRTGPRRSNSLAALRATWPAVPAGLEAANSPRPPGTQQFRFELDGDRQAVPAAGSHKAGPGIVKYHLKSAPARKAAMAEYAAGDPAASCVRKP